MTDIFDRATESEEQDRMDAMQHHHLQRQREISLQKKAIAARGELTNCIGCDEEISPERRHAIPDCTKCAECQRAAEVRNKNMNR